MKYKLLSLLVIGSLAFTGCTSNSTTVANEQAPSPSVVTQIAENFEVEDDSSQVDDDVAVDIEVEKTAPDIESTNTLINEDALNLDLVAPDVFDEEFVLDEVEYTHEVDTIIEESFSPDLVESRKDDGSTDLTLSYNLTGNIDIESHVFDQVNELRDSLGLDLLTTNNILVEGAYTRAKELPEFFGHSRPDGRDWYTIFDEIPYNFQACGENLTTGTGLTRDQAYNKIFDSWYNSPGHYANMVNPDFEEIGIAVHFDSNGTYYATQIFGTEF